MRLYMMFIKEDIDFCQKHDNSVLYCGRCENIKTARGKRASANGKK